jgi:hypothetical protein
MLPVSAWRNPVAKSQNRKNWAPISENCDKFQGLRTPENLRAKSAAKSQHRSHRDMATNFAEVEYRHGFKGQFHGLNPEVKPPLISN